MPTDVMPGLRRKKDTRRWCKGVVGRAHVPMIVKHQRYGNAGWYTCASRWSEAHEQVCSECGKILIRSWDLPAADCPIGSRV